MPSTFGERLRDLRKDKNLLQSEFGDRFDLSPSAIGSYERNEREPAYHHLVAFADFFRVSLDYLMGRSDERLTVADYTAKDSYKLDELLAKYDIYIDHKKLDNGDKKRLYGVACGLVLGVESEYLQNS